MFANLLNKKIYIYHIYISIQTLNSVLCWITFFSVITALSLLGYASWTSLAHLYLRSFSHSSLQILSSYVILDRKRCCTAIFRSLQRCLIGFKSGLWLGHSRRFRDLSQSHSCVVLAVWLESLSCLKVNLRPSLRSWALWSSFSSRISWLVSQSLPLKNIPTAWYCHQHASP